MIESIYSNDNKEKRERAGSNILFRMPKNIRQIGQADSSKKVYVEDYVMTYIRQLAMKDYSNYKAAILLGQFVRNNGTRNIFIRGAVEAKDIDFEMESVFSNETWTNIYDDVKKYFDEVEIVGWYIAKPGMTLEMTDQITKMHVDNFAGQNKVLLMYDSMDKEEVFYIYDNNKLCRQHGYYIYYEKNEEMQNYMVENKEPTCEEEGCDNRAIQEIRQVIEGKKDLKEGKGQGGVVHLLYGASTLLAVVVLVIGATMLNNYDQMKTMEQTLNVISDHVVGPNEKAVQEAGQGEAGGAESKDQVKSFDNGIDNNNDLAADDSLKEEITAVNKISGDVDKAVGETEGNSQTEGDGQIDETDKSLKESAQTNSTTSNPESIEGGDPEELESSKSEKIGLGMETEKEQNISENSKTNEKISDMDSKRSSKKASIKKTKDTKTARSAAKTINYYTIKKGDTLVSISARYYNSVKYVEDILEANNIDNQNKIMVGQKIILPEYRIK